MSATLDLGRWAANCQLDEVPGSVCHEAKRAILNFMAVAIGGGGHTAVERALAVAQATGGSPRCTLLGRMERVDPLNAALLGGIASHVLDFDDTHVPTILHPSGPCLPPLLALAEWRGGSGADLLIAFVVAVETACRAALSVFPAHYDAGWHITGTAGAIGAAAGAGRFLGLTDECLAQALSLGATQAAGVQEQFGHMAKSFHAGRAAHSGLLSALLVEQGFTASTAGLEAPHGWCHVASSAVQVEQLTAGLGSRWELLNNTYKPFPCGVVTHPVIDGALEITRQNHVEPQDIAAIELKVHARVPVLCGKAEPRTGLEGKFSIHHCCTVALVDRTVGQAQFADRRVVDPILSTLRKKVSVEVSPELQPDQAVVRVTRNDGSRLECRVEHALGALEKPMSDREIEAKFRNLAEPIIGPERANRLAAAVWSLEGARSCRELIEWGRKN